MRLSVLAVCFVLLNVGFVCCFHTDGDLARVKRSNVTERFSLQSLNDGVKSFGSKVSNYASKGYGEFKNLFSKDRKVGDYTINNMDVRVAEEEDYEEVGANKRPKRSAQKSDEVDRSPLTADQLSEIMKDIKVFETTASKCFEIFLLRNFIKSCLIYRSKQSRNEAGKQRRNCAGRSEAAVDPHCAFDLSRREKSC